MAKNYNFEVGGVVVHEHRETVQQCGSCIHYSSLAGSSPAGWCTFTTNTSLPFWLEKFLADQQTVRKGDDVMADDGADCYAWSA
jgi:hypothetical protein